jgi:hypothetical protein
LEAFDCWPLYTAVRPGNTLDFDQRFNMPSGNTVLSRIVVPIAPVGNGANMLFSVYADTGGVPNVAAGPVVSTMIPASFFTNTGAKNGLSDSSAPSLANPSLNTMMGVGGPRQRTYTGPTGDSSGVATFPSISTFGNYQIMVGGTNIGSSTPLNVVNLVPYLGDNLMGTAVAQPSLPATSAYGAVTATSDFIVATGGDNGSGPTNYVWVAGWDSLQGSIASWSSQTALPTPLYHHASAADSTSETVYIIGGATSAGGAAVNSVWYAQMNNGQISSWTAGPVFPSTIYSSHAAVINGWLVVAGGSTSSTSLVGVSNVYMSKINSSDGSLGPWQPGPSLQVGVYTPSPGWNTCVTDNALIIVSGLLGPTTVSNSIQVMTITADDGAADQWWSSHWSIGPSQKQASAFRNINGQWQIIYLDLINSVYVSLLMIPVPLVSVPLPASGLSTVNPYHLVMQQNQYQDQSSYLELGVAISPGTTSDVLVSNRHSGTWTTYSNDVVVPMSVYGDGSNPNLLPLLHTWEDLTVPAQTNQGNRSTQLLYNQYEIINGVMEATMLPNDALNSNPTFATTVSPWTALNGATITRSSAQTHGGFAFSGLITPNGSTANPYAESENVAVDPGSAVAGQTVYYWVNGWVYSTSGFTISLGINWFDNNGGFVANSNNGVVVPAATWTFLNNYFAAPATAAFAGINPAYFGTPAAANTLFLSNVFLTLAPEYASVLSSVVKISYPAGSSWPPVGVSQLVS